MKAETSTIYQIYPLGALGAPFKNDHVQSSRLNRIENWISHLKKLNMNMVLFNPLMQSSTHGYDTADYFQVDSRLGSNEDLARLCSKLHENGIGILFDGVFNHVGREFKPFADVLSNRENSRYKDWFIIDFNGNNSYDDHLWYANWEGYDELVKLNLKNPEVVSYLLDVVDSWIDQYQIDGLRLDVAYCLDHDFLRTLRRHVKAKNPDFFLLGETLHGDYNQWVNDSMLDSCTNYECYKGLYSSFNSKNFYEILFSFNRQFGKENWCLYTGKHLACFVDNHDVNRIASTLENKKQLPALYAMLFTMPGIPVVYYGSEWGMEGVKDGTDLQLRKEVETPEWNDLTEVIARLARIHQTHPELIDGDYAQIAINNPWCIYARSLDGKTLWTAINLLDEPVTIPVGEHRIMKDLMSNEEVLIDGGVPVDANSFRILSFE